LFLLQIAVKISARMPACAPVACLILACHNVLRMPFGGATLWPLIRVAADCFLITLPRASRKRGRPS
jgi:hypothetical protein